MRVAADTELYARGAATLVASWGEYVRGAPDAAVRRLDGVAAAVFPSGPEREVYNNALLSRDLGPTERVAAVDGMEAAYASAGVKRYAAWVHESDGPMRAELSDRGYAVDETTRAMGMALGDLAAERPDVALEPLGWTDYVAYLMMVGVPDGLLSGADPKAFGVLAARLAGESVATGLRPQRRLRHLQRLDDRGRAAARPRHRDHRAPAPRRPRAWLPHREPAVHADGRADLYRGRVP
ncbi:MAG TPA: hypothetical protein VHZ75_03350 [Solirubrobacteraceae bacterium]|jgi:hypothetical protein|nr:hypothetical protein [Solirubrobacteraceae bacterium]